MMSQGYTRMLLEMLQEKKDVMFSIVKIELMVFAHVCGDGLRPLMVKRCWIKD